jgi:DNA repair protein RecO (recombination protein O)
MGPSQTSAAIILRARAYGESDKIVTFLTEDVGKLSGIAKGAKNSRRRFANCLDAFTRVRVHFRTRTGAGLVFMESCDLVTPPGALTDPVRFAYASYLVELVDRLTAEGQPVRELYHLLDDGLDVLTCGAATTCFLRAFELRLLHHAGYDPELRTCGRCRRALVPVEGAFLETMRGSLLCTECRSGAQTVVPVAGETLAALDAIRSIALADAQARRFPAVLAADAATLMGHLLALHLSGPLRSVKLIGALSAQ